MEEEKPRLIIFDLDDVMVEWGFIFKKDAKYILYLLKEEFGFDVKIVTSRWLVPYILAVAWLWINNLDIKVEMSGPNGNKADYYKSAYMFADNDPKHVLSVLESGKVERVCLFSNDKEAKLETEKEYFIVSDWWDIVWVAFVQ